MAGIDELLNLFVSSLCAILVLAPAGLVLLLPVSHHRVNILDVRMMAAEESSDTFAPNNRAREMFACYLQPRMLVLFSDSKSGLRGVVL
jgi:hypothetical protein